MRNIFLLFLSLPLFQVLAQNCYINITDNYLMYDYSELWREETFQGTIGNDNKRIQIRLTSVEKNINNPSLYFVRGKSKVGNNICDFMGNITIDSITVIDHSNPMCEGPDYPFGKIYCTYKLFEDSTQKFVGTFHGHLKSWFTDPEKELSKTNGWTTDYGNSFFIGSWKGYNQDYSKYCSWASSKAPSKNGDLYKHYDNEFYLFNPKYMDEGWKSYALANLEVFLLVPKNFDKNGLRNPDEFYSYTEEEIEHSIEIENIKWWK